jgi:hypothetical protein
MRVVGLMALVAGHAAGMLGGNDLGKASWLGRVFFVATPAEVGNVGQLRNVRRGIVGMLRQGAMTGFARYVSVLAGCARFGLVVMAENASVLPRVSDGPLPDQPKRTGAIVAVLSKSLGDNRATHHQKYGQAGQQNQSRANQMTCVPHQTAHCSLFPRKPELCAGTTQWRTRNIITNRPVYL